MRCDEVFSERDFFVRRGRGARGELKALVKVLK
jgi:hypothetical protein